MKKYFAYFLLLALWGGGVVNFLYSVRAQAASSSSWATGLSSAGQQGAVKIKATANGYVMAGSFTRPVQQGSKSMTNAAWIAHFDELGNLTSQRGYYDSKAASYPVDPNTCEYSGTGSVAVHIVTAKQIRVL